MNQNRYKKLLWCGVFLIGVLLFPVRRAYASGDALQVSLPIQQIFMVENTASLPVDQTVDYIFAAVSENAPMPEKSKNGQYAFAIQGTQKQFDIPLSFEHGGIYTYTLSVKNKDSGECSYDKTCYTITIFVQNEKDRLTAQVIVENGKQEKCEEIRYQHTYRAQAQADTNMSGPTKTGDPGSGMLYLGLVLSGFGILAVLAAKKWCDVEQYTK